MRFRLRQMEVFRAVMLTRSINGAAKLLFTSQPPVSRTVSHTEQTLGLALFNRVKGKLVPTAEGEALWHPNLTVTPFTERRIVCVLPLGHELAQRDAVSIKELGCIR